MNTELNIDALKTFAADFVAAEPERLGSDGWWRPPLLVCARLDSRFDELPRMAYRDHLHPRQLLPTARSILVCFLPFRKSLVKENRSGQRPCRNWAVSYVQTNDLIGRLTKALGDLLGQQGFKSGLTPATHNFDEAALMARWSHKHLGWLAGLGRFGMHRMLITPAGCAGRLGSLVTEAELGDHPLIETNEACLLKFGKPCGRCIASCPIEALKEDDFDRRACWDRLKENRRSMAYFAELPETTHVCGKCVALMPCSFKNPVARVLRREEEDRRL